MIKLITGLLPARSMVVLCLFSSIAIASDDSLSQTETEHPDFLDRTYWSVQFENDALTNSNEDKYYSNGLQVSILKLGETSPLHDKIYSTLFGREEYVVSGTEYSIGHTIFTPEDITVYEEQPDDRPYAGWLYFNISSGYLSERLQNISILHFMDYTIGIIGPSAGAEGLQNSVHRMIGSPQANGWEHQLKDELGLNITRTTRWQLHPIKFRGWDYDVTAHAVTALGNVYTYGGGGVMFRVGNNLGDDIGPPSIRPSFPGSAGFGFTPDNRSWYFYMGHESRLVLHNIFLDGNTFADSANVERELLIGDLQYGFVFRFNQMRLAYTNMVRTREFNNQDDMTNYGAINVSFSY